MSEAQAVKAREREILADRDWDFEFFCFFFDDGGRVSSFNFCRFPEAVVIRRCRCCQCFLLFLLVGFLSLWFDCSLSEDCAGQQRHVPSSVLPF